jgi:hypothetical protein
MVVDGVLSVAGVTGFVNLDGVDVVTEWFVLHNG